MKQRFTKRTRLVSALLTLAMVFTFLPFSALAAEGVTDDSTIELSEHNFPDEAFREYLKQFDIKKDNKLVPAERKAVKKIDVHGKSIGRLNGIEFFPNLETLYCYNNTLTSLDVSKNEKLADLWCSQNNLTSLDVSKNPELKELWCSDNNLTSLDVSKNIALQKLACSGNQLTSLDVSENEKLEILLCSGNQLTSLDVSQNSALEQLSCYDNQLTSLDVSKNTNLTSLNCNQNQLTSLDVSKNTNLTSLNCNQNRLTSLDVSQTAVTTLKASDNQIDINVETTPRTFDLSTLPGKFDVTKATNWNGGTVSGKTLKVNESATQVTYTYDCGKGCNETFTLNVNVVPDGTVTPPSGGGSTGGGSTGGGSTGGGSTGGGSTGGGSTGGGTPGGSTGGTTIPPEAGKYQLTVTDGVATVNGITRDVLNVKPGDTVTLTADTTKFPENEEFGWWEITPYGSVSNTLTGQYQRTATFTMPNENVSARAMSKSAGVSTGGDDGGGGGGAAIPLVGGAAVAGLVGYGVYSYVSEQQLKALLPEGVAMPENRAQTALLLWNTAGRPEPAEAPAFKDVADPDTAKAAQWCVEHGLMDRKLGGRFAPDNSDPAYKTLNAYQQLVG